MQDLRAHVRLRAGRDRRGQARSDREVPCGVGAVRGVHVKGAGTELHVRHAALELGIGELPGCPRVVLGEFPARHRDLRRAGEAVDAARVHEEIEEAEAVGGLYQGNEVFEERNLEIRLREEDAGVPPVVLALFQKMRSKVRNRGRQARRAEVERAESDSQKIEFRAPGGRSAGRVLGAYWLPFGVRALAGLAVVRLPLRRPAAMGWKSVGESGWQPIMGGIAATRSCRVVHELSVSPVVGAPAGKTGVRAERGAGKEVSELDVRRGGGEEWIQEKSSLCAHARYWPGR
ncbi:hypothetical protein GCM10027440_02860 [Nocardiopsis coralliicola]